MACHLRLFIICGRRLANRSLLEHKDEPRSGQIHNATPSREELTRNHRPVLCRPFKTDTPKTAMKVACDRKPSGLVQ